MMGQIDLFQAELKESDVFEILKDDLFIIIDRNNVSHQKLDCKKGKTYSSVWYDTQLVFRICSRGDHNYFGISDTYRNLIPDSVACFATTDGKSDGFTNYAFDPNRDGIMLFAPVLCECLDKAIDSVQKEFDCCSRYVECSDAQRCTNPNADMATGCGYRRIMKTGKIFYGKNRNVE